MGFLSTVFLALGTFAEVAMLIRSITQILYDVVQDFQNPYWLWLLDIRCYLRYMLMPKISTSQVEWFSACLLYLGIFES